MSSVELAGELTGALNDGYNAILEGLDKPANVAALGTVLLLGCMLRPRFDLL